MADHLVLPYTCLFAAMNERRSKDIYDMKGIDFVDGFDAGLADEGQDNSCCVRNE